MMERIREAIELCLEVEQEVPPQQFIGVQRIAQSSPPDRTASHCRLETGWF